ncbi:MAG: sigma-70 family RNA polymerase sigma factor [Muribaculaceae bacterium]|nr:sigma-70 family RNA polymerase sigma factor [Muribaculaceae bacterium]
MDNLERQIITDILNGRTERFDYIVRQYGRRVFALIVRIVDCREDAEELVQDTMVKAYSHLADFKKSSSLATWLYRIAYTTAISHARRTRAPETYIDEARLHDVTDADADALLDGPADDHRTEALHRAINRLSPAERALVTLHYFDSLPLSEVARITDMTLSNVKVKLLRIRRKLYLMITDEQR